MPRARTLFYSMMVALFSAGFVVATAQDRADDKAPAARARVATSGAAPRPDPARMQQLLIDWEAQSAKLKSLEVSIYRIDKILNWGEEEHYVGQASFKAPQLANLDFRKVKMELRPDPKEQNKKILSPVLKNKQVVSTPFQTIVCTDKEVWQYRWDAAQIFIFPLDRNARKRAIEEGPLPFLFNMKAAEVVQRYEVVLQAEDQKKYTVRIQPRLDIDKESFSIAWIYLDHDFLLPTRIFLLSPDRETTKDFRLSNIRANQAVDAYKFVGVVPPGKNWTVERNPGGTEPARGSTRTKRGQANPQAAQRPGADGAAQPR
jgi:TIGR03009 family protein